MQGHKNYCFINKVYVIGRDCADFRRIFNKIGVLALVFVCIAATACHRKSYSGNETKIDPASQLTEISFTDNAKSTDAGTNEAGCDSESGVSSDMACVADEVTDDAGGDSTIITVHVCGAVNIPGVYQLADGSRIYEAIKAAGGMTSAANDASINQAELLADGTQVYIPEVGEAPKTGAANYGNSGSSIGTGNSAAGAKININTATKEELMTLNGIGASKASSIIDYRTKHGSFSKPDDLMKVEGIKEGTYNKIKDMITI
ncbi:MAG: helix-hairpin-helix domain-containing protein [Lachnospiraceae bacterium]|jgi:competence protein ComEA|nr:helix-hairpin-helix domain-containing protein [Lachnospiraceae bacterium]